MYKQTDDMMHVDGFSLNDIVVRLDSVAEHIAGLIAEHEEHFLSLGSRLHDLSSQSDSLYRRASSLAEMTSGQEMQSSINALSEEFEEMTGVCRLDLSEESRAQLKKTLESVQGLDAYMDQFRRIVRNLRMLGISTRIESARLGSMGRGFVTLADDVDKLAGNIVTHTSRIADSSRELSGLVASALDQATTIISQQKLCSEELFDHIRTNLEDLEELSRKSRQLSTGLPAKMKKIANDIGEVVAFLQFHDIIRQQVEHVEEAIRDILGEAKERIAQGVDPHQELVIAGWIQDVCALQASQLENGRKRFFDAVERIKDHLWAIAGIVDELCGEIRETVGSADDLEGTILDTIEKNMAQALDSINTFAKQGEGMSRVVRSVAGTVQDMSSFVTDIEEVGSEIELISLNASIKAAHTGEQGRALGVLASSIQRLSVDARSQTELVSGELTSISDASRSLIFNADQAASEGEVRDLVAGMEGMLDNVKKLNDRSRQVFRELLDRGKELAVDIQTLSQDVQFHVQACEDMDTTRKELDSVVRELDRTIPEGVEEDRSERLQKMLERYTMEAERIIHKNVMEKAPEEDTEQVDLFDPAHDSEFGDNVELF
jgi:methyl-accepting chemotaxis protein